MAIRMNSLIKPWYMQIANGSYLWFRSLICPSNLLQVLQMFIQWILVFRTDLEVILQLIQIDLDDDTINFDSSIAKYRTGGCLSPEVLIDEGIEHAASTDFYFVLWGLYQYLSVKQQIYLVTGHLNRCLSVIVFDHVYLCICLLLLLLLFLFMVAFVLPFVLGSGLCLL